jgi:hypothetical protein
MKRLVVSVGVEPDDDPDEKSRESRNDRVESRLRLHDTT